jgi:hypothetical protein
LDIRKQRYKGKKERRKVGGKEEGKKSLYQKKYIAKLQIV